MSTIPFSARPVTPVNHSRWRWVAWAVLPLLAVVGTVAAGATVGTLALCALVLGATFLRLVARPRVHRLRP